MLFNFQDARINLSVYPASSLRKPAPFSARFRSFELYIKEHSLASYQVSAPSEVLGLVWSAYLLYHITLRLSRAFFVNSLWTRRAFCDRQPFVWVANIFIVPLFDSLVNPSFVKDLLTQLVRAIYLLSCKSYSFARTLRFCCVFALGWVALASDSLIIISPFLWLVNRFFAGFSNLYEYTDLCRFLQPL